MKQIINLMTEAINKMKQITEKIDEPIIVSDCCSADPVLDSEDLGLCPECKDHCEYININNQTK